jgi:hypothetical protein
MDFHGSYFLLLKIDTLHVVSSKFELSFTLFITAKCWKIPSVV